MKAATVTSFGQPLVIGETARPVPRAGEVLVKTSVCGVCHTDLHAADGDWPVKPKVPFIPGHEVIGVVAAVGEGVRNWREGDPIGVAWLHDACDACEYCISGWETLCGAQHNTGYGVDGGFAEYMIASANYATRLPEDVDLGELAPILCAGVTTYKGIKETDVKPGEWLAVCGIGGLGHVAVQYAKAMGLHVAAIDIAEDKLMLARHAGADIVIDGSSELGIRQLLRETGGGVHGALVTAVSAPAFAQCLRLLRPKGTMSLVGLPPGAFPLPIFDVVLKRLTVRGSIVGTRKDLAEALQFAAEGKVRATVERRRLEEINTVFADLKAGRVRGRIVLEFT
jgi:alcohol dehydrogenase, propanol-preferring